jgi:hypothetical protein
MSIFPTQTERAKIKQALGHYIFIIRKKETLLETILKFLFLAFSYR